MERSSKLETERRLNTVREWILSDYSYMDIIRSAAITFGVSERQAERYYSKAFNSFSETNKQSIASQKSYYKAKKLRLIRDMNPLYKSSPSGVRAINQVLNDMAKLDGIILDRIELSGPDGNPIPTEVTVKIVQSNAPPFASNEKDVDV